MMKAGTLWVCALVSSSSWTVRGRESERGRADAHVDGEAGEPDDRVGGLVREVESDRVAALEALGEEPVCEAVDGCVGRQVGEGEEGKRLGQRDARPLAR